MDQQLIHIIEGCKKGNTSMQNQLILMYSPKLYIVCKRYTKNHQLAQDALQETFINILKYIHTYIEKGSFEAWISRIAINSSIATYKKMNAGLITYDSSITDVHEETILSESLDFINKEYVVELLKGLSKAQYLVFNLYVNEELNYNEIAELLNISEHTVRATLSRARSRVLEILKQREENKYYLLNTLEK